MLFLMLIYLVIDAIFSLAIRDYWDLGKEGAKDDKFVVLVSFCGNTSTVSKMISIA